MGFYGYVFGLYQILQVKTITLVLSEDERIKMYKL